MGSFWRIENGWKIIQYIGEYIDLKTWILVPETAICHVKSGKFDAHSYLGLVASNRDS